MRSHFSSTGRYAKLKRRNLVLVLRQPMTRLFDFRAARNAVLCSVKCLIIAKYYLGNHNMQSEHMIDILIEGNKKIK